MKILAADDEYYALKSIVKMINEWANNKTDVTIYEAEDGKEAQEKIDEFNIDIVITDIKMPIKDGISLASHIYNNKIDIPVIIVSGYAEFTYAQEAMKYGVEQYLLKPIDKGKLFSILDDIYNDYLKPIDKGKLFSILDDIYNDYLKKSVLYLEKNLNEYLYKNREFPKKYIKDIFKDQTQNIMHNLCLIQTDKGNVDKVKSYFIEHLKDNGSFNWFCASSSKYSNQLIVINYSILYKCSANFEEKILNKYNLILKELIDIYDSKFAIYCSKSFKDFLKLKNVYSKANHLLNYRLINGWNKVITSEDINLCDNNDLEYEKLIKINIYQKIVSGNSREAIKTMKFIFDKLTVSKSYSVFNFQYVCNEMVSMLNLIIDNFKIKRVNDEIEKINYLNYIDLSFYNDTQEIIEFFIQNINILSKQSKNLNCKADIVKEVKKFIDTNYSYDIRLDVISKNYYIDSSYLSKLFKEETGFNFSEYLLNIRMEKAEELLMGENELSITNIANAVGFNDSSYFIQLFKKYFGKTPKKYKRDNQK